MELYNKKFVYFDWDPILDSKKGFFGDSINHIKENVKGNRTLWFGEICHNVNTNTDYPFGFIDESGSSHCFRFCYYDPYYEFRKAYLEGKQLQFRNSDDWLDVDGEPLFTSDEYRIKPMKWHVVISNEGTLGIAKSTSKHIYFTGDEEECKKWIDEHKNLVGTMKAWEEGETIQYLHHDEWRDVANGVPLWGNDTYRVKPKVWYVVLDDYGLSRTNSIADKYVVFEGTEDECIQWLDEYKKFEEIMVAWKQDKAIQYKDDGEWKDWQLIDIPRSGAFAAWKEWRIKPDGCKGCMVYVPFDTVQELIDAWDNKYPQNKNRPEGTMPLIWIKNKEKNRVYLITDFLFDKYFEDDVGTEDSNFQLKELFVDYTFLDNSIIGKVKEK